MMQSSMKPHAKAAKDTARASRNQSQTSLNAKAQSGKDAIPKPKQSQRRDAETCRGTQRKKKGRALLLRVPLRPLRLCVKACSASVAALPRCESPRLCVKSSQPASNFDYSSAKEGAEPN